MHTLGVKLNWWFCSFKCAVDYVGNYTLGVHNICKWNANKHFVVMYSGQLRVHRKFVIVLWFDLSTWNGCIPLELHEIFKRAGKLGVNRILSIRNCIVWNRNQFLRRWLNTYYLSFATRIRFFERKRIFFPEKPNPTQMWKTIFFFASNWAQQCI